LNLELKKALRNKDVISVAKSAAKKYSGILSQDEIEDCIINGVWYSLERFDNTRGVKFTTFLHRGVIIQCQKRLKFNRKPLDLIPEYTQCPSNFELNVDMKDEVNNCEDPSILYERFYMNKTLAEIAKARNVTSQTIRNKIKKNVSQIRNRFIK
jgi:DNA-directed RNA polymerase specialized sigma subunit